MDVMDRPYALSEQYHEVTDYSVPQPVHSDYFPYPANPTYQAYPGYSTGHPYPTNPGSTVPAGATPSDGYELLSPISITSPSTPGSLPPSASTSSLFSVMDSATSSSAPPSAPSSILPVSSAVPPHAVGYDAYTYDHGATAAAQMPSSIGQSPSSTPATVASGSGPAMASASAASVTSYSPGRPVPQQVLTYQPAPYGYDHTGVSGAAAAAAAAAASSYGPHGHAAVQLDPNGAATPQSAPANITTFAAAGRFQPPIKFHKRKSVVSATTSGTGSPAGGAASPAYRRNSTSGAPPGPIPASTPTLVRRDATGVEWISFDYSKDRVKTSYCIRCDVESVDVTQLDPKFKKDNCIYPRACVPPEEYSGNRQRYESECNCIGWCLSFLNPELQGQRGLIQRAVDSWRNTNADPSFRSRRVRRMSKKAAQRSLSTTDVTSPQSVVGAPQPLVMANAQLGPVGFNNPFGPNPPAYWGTVSPKAPTASPGGGPIRNRVNSAAAVVPY